MGDRRPRLSDPAPGGSPAAPIVVVMGVTGVGKSTIGAALAARMSWSYVDGDSLHPTTNVAKMTNGVPLDDEDRWPWLAALHQVMEDHRRAHSSLVVACSALKSTYCDALVGELPDVVFVYLTAPRDLIADRLERRRGHFMPPSLLASQLEALEHPADAITVEVVDAPVDVTVSKIVDRLRDVTGG